MVSMRLTTQTPKPGQYPTQSQIWIDRPLSARFMLAAHGPDSASIYLIRLEDTPGSRGLQGQTHIDARGHILRAWSGPPALAALILAELNARLAQGFDASVDVVEADIRTLANACSPPFRRHRDLDEDLRTGRDAPSTEDDTTP
jgi:hypothetical protein